jgi:hypothetical protein
MISTLVLWLVYAVFLKLAIGVATDVGPANNGLGRAFVTAAVLSIGQGLLANVGGLVLLLWPIAWLFIIKRSYDIGWGRAVLVWLALVALWFTVAVLLLIPLGLVAALAVSL